MSDVKRIITKFVDDQDSLTEEELERLVDALSESEELAQALKDQLVMDDLLSQRLAFDRQNFVAQVTQRIHDHETGMPRALADQEDLLGQVRELRDRIVEDFTEITARRRRMRRVQFWSVTAICALLVAVGAGVWYQHWTPSQIAMVQAVSGSASVIREGVSQPLVPDMPVLRGDRLLSSAESSIVVRYEDGTTICLAANTSMDFGTDRATRGKSAFLEKGHMTADVAPQGAGRPMTFDTPAAKVRVLGTRLALSISAEATRLKVTKGLVEMTRKSDDAQVVVAANQFAVATRQEEPMKAMAVVFPNGGWQTTKPEEVGLDAEKLKALEQYVGGRGCVVRRGYLVHSWGDVKQSSCVYGASEAVATFFLLRALQEGKIAKLDARVAESEPRLTELNDELAFKDRDITWRQLANQTSCYGVTDPPGTAFGASNRQIGLLWSALFEGVYEVPYEKWDRDRLIPGLADPLGFQDRVSVQEERGYLKISPRDLARFGLLWLQRGKWQDDQVLDAQYVDMALGNPVSNAILPTDGGPAEMIYQQVFPSGDEDRLDHFGSYSFGWWINGRDRAGKRMWPAAPLDAFAALGHEGNEALFVLPSLDLVVAYDDGKLPRVKDQPIPARQVIARIVEALAD